MAIVGGSLAGVVVLRVFPPVPPRTRAARLLGLTLQDLRGLARDPRRWRPDPWRTRVYGRLLVLPAEADPADGSRLLAALTIGLQLMDLHAAAPHPAATDMLRSVGVSLGSGNVDAARDALGRLEDAIPSWSTAAAEQTQLRLQGATQEISRTLGAYRDYFTAIIG